MPQIEAQVASLSTQENLTDNFHLPLTEQANTELQQLLDEVQQIQESVIEPEEKDSWSYIWGNSTYSSTKLYHYTFKNVNPPKPFSDQAAQSTTSQTHVLELGGPTFLQIKSSTGCC